ncbi:MULTISPECIES: HPP family protein [unclassified Amycolatopsis]|uniref:CBS domain-containing protein n=1 Tax=unclassified Amycolatopsis TaxID=2618356 RepID=UPI002105D7B6|nr:CBS domain-containing protein [Amycolatopsis sp. DSM 110486]
MTEHGFTTLPVVDQAAKLVGLVSEVDLVQAGFPSDSTATGDPDTGAMLGRHRTVATVMRSPGLAVPGGLDPTELAHRMTEAGVRALPLVDNGILVGMVTFRDVLRAVPATGNS